MKLLSLYGLSYKDRVIVPVEITAYRIRGISTNYMTDWNQRVRRWHRKGFEE